MMRKGILAGLCAVLLIGCGGLQLERAARQGAADANSEATQTLRQNAVEGPVVDNGDSFRIKRLSQVYVSTASRHAPKPLPAVFSKRRVTLNLVDLVYIDDLAQIIAKIGGMPVSLSPELLSGVTKDKSDNEDDSEEEDAVAGSDTGYQHRLRVSFNEGSLQELLDYVATALGISWRYENGQIRLYRFTTRTFMIAAQQGSHTGRATVTNRATGSTGTADTSAISSSDLQTQINVDTSVWDDLRSTVPTLLSEGGKYFVSESSSTLTVHDTAINVGIVDEYVRSLNEVLSRQVQFHVRVLSVNQDDGNRAGINWSAVYENLGTQFNFTSDRGDISSPQQNTLTATILKSSRFNSSQLFVDALSSQGEVTEVSSPQLITLNNQPTHLIMGNRLSYVAKLESTIAANAGTTTTAELADLITGFSVLLQPTILNTNDLQVQIALDRSTLNQIQTFGDATTQSLVLQAPDVDISNSIQRVRVKTGQTIVLTGFEQVTNSNNRQGTTDSDAWWSGGRKSHTSSRMTIVVLLTPVIL